MLEDQLECLERSPRSRSDHELALSHAPYILFDRKEPFFPSVVGYSVFRENAASASFPRIIQLNNKIVIAIEYAIWWDWDIQHLCELEHIWVYIDRDGKLVDAEASWHGGYHQMLDEKQQVPMQGSRLSLHSEPGKHAFAPSPRWLLQRKAKTLASNGVHAGKMGVHVTPLFEGIIRDDTPQNDRLVHTYLESQQFEPTFTFTNRFDLRRATFVPWQHLFQWIPDRIGAWTEHLRATIPPEQRRVLRIAHRGASAYALENSLESIRVAANLGADMVEIDIRATADGFPIVIHDSSLKRTHGIDGNISDFSMDELRNMTANKGQIISFDQAVSLCRELGMGLYLDIKQLKTDAAIAMFEILDRQHYLGHTVFGSFRPDYLADIKAARPDATTSILFGAVHLDAIKLAQSIGADYVHPCWENRARQPHKLLTADWVAAVHKANLGIVCWHEERPSEIAALKALGIDAICSDMPELL